MTGQPPTIKIHSDKQPTLSEPFLIKKRVRFNRAVGCAQIRILPCGHLAMPAYSSRGGGGLFLPDSLCRT